MLAFLVLGGVIGAVLGVILSSQDGGASQMEPTPGAPIVIPSTSRSPTRSERFESLLDILGDVSGEALLDESSVQFQALEFQNEVIELGWGGSTKCIAVDQLCLRTVVPIVLPENGGSRIYRVNGPSCLSMMKTTRRREHNAPRISTQESV
jgi:hypothetical protein